MQTLFAATLTLALTLFSGAATANPQWSCHSDKQQAALLELYTSQGCSSCPPADHWLSAIRDREDLWSRVVPVAWHVTYWDYLGWRDPFADAANDRRQRQMAAAAGAQVYTPGIFLNRKEYRRWRRLPPGASTESRRDVGILRASSEGNTVQVQFQPVDGLALEAPRVEMAFLRSDRRTDVKAGENRGRQLRHDFVAGALSGARLERSEDGWVAKLAATPEAGSVAVALWVTDRQGNFLQATGTWLAQP